MYVLNDKKVDTAVYITKGRNWILEYHVHSNNYYFFDENEHFKII